jgi:AAA family ATP:ADP antiporter
MVNETGDEGLHNRVEAARLLGQLPDCFDPLLSRLLADSDTHVVCEAIHSVGMLRKRRLVPELLDRLADHRLAPSAAQALGRFGDSIVGGLRDHLCDSAVPIQARREIPSVLMALGTSAAASVLLDNLLQGDTMLRFRTITALNKLCQLNPGIAMDVQMLETVLAAEILGHYRSYQILATIGASTDAADPLARALNESMQQELERIFRLLNLLHPRLDLHSAYIGLQSTSASVHDNALEFLDNVLKSQLRDMLVPLLDSKITVAERAKIAHRLVRAKIENQEQAVAELVASEDPWLKSCGAYAIGTLGIKSLEGQLDRCLNESDPLLRETARAAKLRLEALAAKS